MKKLGHYDNTFGEDDQACIIGIDEDGVAYGWGDNFEEIWEDFQNGSDSPIEETRFLKWSGTGSPVELGSFPYLDGPVDVNSNGVFLGANWDEDLAVDIPFVFEEGKTHSLNLDTWYNINNRSITKTDPDTGITSTLSLPQVSGSSNGAAVLCQKDENTGEYVQHLLQKDIEDKTWTLTEAQWVNDLGMVAGLGTHNGQKAVFILVPVEIQNFKAESVDSGVQTSGTFEGIAFQPGDLVIWGQSRVSSFIKLPDNFPLQAVEPRFVQDITPKRTRIYTNPDSQGHTREIMQYQNQKVLDGVLDKTDPSMVTIQRQWNLVYIESRDEPTQGGGMDDKEIDVNDKFDVYLQLQVYGGDWQTFSKVVWTFNGIATRSGTTWSGGASVGPGTGTGTQEVPVMQPDVHPITYVPQ